MISLTANRLRTVADWIRYRTQIEWSDWLYKLADQFEDHAHQRIERSVAGEWWEQANEVEGGCPCG